MNVDISRHYQIGKCRKKQKEKDNLGRHTNEGVRAEAEKGKNMGGTGRGDAKEKRSVILMASLELDSSAHDPVRDQCTP